MRCITCVLATIVLSGAVFAGGAEALEPRRLPVKPAQTTLESFHQPDRVYVKLRDDTPLQERAGRLVPVRAGAPDLRAERDALHALGGAWEPVHEADRASLAAMRDAGERNTGKALPDLASEFILTLPAGADAAGMIDRLNAMPIVELAAPMPAPPPPPLAPDFSDQQGYAEGAPGGVGATQFMTTIGARGEGVRVLDIEYDFNENHLDLPQVAIVGGAYQDAGFGDAHGTAVLGEMAGIDNGWGVTGIAPDAQYAFSGVFRNGSWNVARAITDALTYLQRGDIILLEQQTYGPNATPQDSAYVPVEWNISTYNAIVTATANGVIVIEAAGNGGQNLDAPEFAAGNNGHHPFLPENDSGAIIVGAGAPDLPGFNARSWLSFSTYGSRVNAQGWGYSVTTTGYGGLHSEGGPNLYFTRTFSGTSSASPIVAGACALLQSEFKARNSGDVLTPQQMRDLIAQTGTPQTPPGAAQQIGPLPDTMAAAAAFPQGCPGDATGDRTVSFEDLSWVLAAYGLTGVRLSGDVTNDGMINFTDLNAVLSNFATTCEPR